jgi:hypothetical protein
VHAAQQQTVNQSDLESTLQMGTSQANLSLVNSTPSLSAQKTHWHNNKFF